MPVPCSRMSRVLGISASVVLGAILALAAAPLWTRGAFPAAVHIAFSGLCHQDAARSFVIDGAQMAICHRCTGMYAGLALGALAVGLGARVNARSIVGWTLAALALGGHVALGWIAPAIFDHAPLRVVSGLVFGAWSSAAVGSALASLGAPAKATRA